MRFLPLFLAFLLLAPGAQAGVLQVTTGNDKLEDVKLSTAATAQVGGRKTELKLAGAGLRYKKVAFVKAKVYVGELFLAAPEALERHEEKALASIEQQKAAALRLTFLRNVDASTVQKSFREALEENGAPLQDAALQGFLNAVKSGGEAKEGSSLAIVAEKLPDGSEAVTYEDSAGKSTTVAGKAGLMKQVLSIWLGKVGDSGLENLKKGLLGLGK